MLTLSEVLLAAVVVGLAVLIIQVHRFLRLRGLSPLRSGDTLRSPPHPGGHRDRPTPPPFDVYAWVRANRIPTPRVPSIPCDAAHGLEEVEPANDREVVYSDVWQRSELPLHVRSEVETLPPKRLCTKT